MKQDDIFNKNWDSSKEEKIEKTKAAGRIYQVYQQLKTIEESFEKRFIFYYILCIVGNYIGCNFRRILTKLSFK